MSPLATSLLVAAGGALGALGRYWLSVGIVMWMGSSLPLATFTANVVGSFVIGFVVVIAAGHAALVAFALAGFLGGFTTFSTFSLETVRLVEDGRMLLALGYAGLSVVCCVLAAGAGMMLSRALFGAA